MTEIDSLRADMAAKKKYVQKLENDVALLEQFKSWLECEKFTIEKNDSSRLHQLVEAVNDCKCYNLNDEIQGRTLTAQFLKDTRVFLVKHDWYAVLKSEADNPDLDIKMPFESCAFEFFINGRPVIILTVQLDGGDPAAIPFVRFPEGWINGNAEDVIAGTAFSFTWKQIRAMCIALDAEVARTDVIRAPHQLNKKREASGKLPMSDFHIVDLTRKRRVYESVGGGSHRSPRLHFRRGHWRHFENAKTWIRWMLVGDPDLGFIDKHYRI